MDLQSLIEEVYTSSDDDIREQNGKLIAAEITSGGLKLVGLVEALGEKLTSSEILTRVVAMGLLAHVFDFLKPDFLSEKELTFIVEFLSNRLKDQHMVIPKVILCVQPIIRCKNLPTGSSVKLIRGLFQEANVQSHTHKHREAFFSTLQYVLRNKLEEMKTMNSEFVMSFLQSMDGEKDPRNLMTLFNTIPIILSNFPLMPFTEEFFEVLTCYFPIDFSPTFHVPGGSVITRADLADGLNLCLSQTNQFVETLFPFLMEKLNSSVIDAKLDSLQLLGLCCERSYTPRDLNPHVSEIWHAMRREVFMGGNEAVEVACINFLRKAFRLFSQNELILKNSINLLFAECKHHLSEPELRLSQPTSRILTAIAESSAEACSAVLLLTVPLLYDQYIVKTSSSERKGILSIMTTVISALRHFPELKLANILPNWDEILGLWFTLLTHPEPDFVMLALSFFTRLLEPRREIGHDSEGTSAESSNLEESNRSLLQAHLLALLTKEDVSREIKSMLISTLEEMARSYSEEFVNISVPRILTLAEETGSGTDDAEDLEDSKADVYSCLAACSSYMKVGVVVIPRLMTLLISHKEAGSNYDAVLQCLSSIVEKGCNPTAGAVSESDEAKGEIEKLSNFLSFHLQDFIRVGLDARSKKNSTAYHLSTTIVRNLIRVADEQRQQELVDLFWNERVKSLDLNGLLEVHVTPMQGLLGEALLGSLRPSITIVKKKELMSLLLEKVLSPLTHEDELGDGDSCQAEIGTETSHPMAMDLLADIRLYAVLLNKASEIDFACLLENVECLLTQRLELNWLETEGSRNSSEVFPNDPGVIPTAGNVSPDELSMESESENQDGRGDELMSSKPVKGTENIQSTPKERRLITFFVWIVKSLALRGSPDLQLWIDKMIKLLGNPKYGPLVAEGFSSVMTDCPYSLNAKSFCRYGFLYKQRIFQISIPKLVAAYKSCQKTEDKSKVQANYICALTAQLKHVPHVVLEMELDNVLPLLVASMSFDMSESLMSRTHNLEKAPILFSTLHALKELLTTNASQAASKSDEGSKSPLQDYFLDMTPRLLRLTQFKEQMEVRMLALQCLQRCAKFPLIVIQPLKEMVVEKLSASLDDPKRLVRKEAALTKNIWILIGAPGGI